MTECLHYPDARIWLCRGDITRIRTDAIVNAANSQLMGGGGVDGAIHRAAGKELLAACQQIGHCNTGEAVVTPGFELPSPMVINTVGPVWKGGNHHEDDLLASCYRKSLEIASAKHMSGIAFPNISTGVYGFPKNRAAEIALTVVVTFLQQHILPKEVLFVCYDSENYTLYQHWLGVRYIPSSMALREDFSGFHES